MKYYFENLYYDIYLIVVYVSKYLVQFQEWKTGIKKSH